MFPSASCKSCLLRLGLALLMGAVAQSVAVSVRAQAIPSSALAHVQVESAGPQIQIEMLLQRARAAMKAGRLVQPPGDNAAEYYAEVLKLDPRNVEARNAIIRLRDVIRVSLAKSHGKSAELQQLDALAFKLTMQGAGDVGGASPIERYTPPFSPPPPSDAQAAGAQASPPPAHPAPPPTFGQAPPSAPQATAPKPTPSAAPPAASSVTSAPVTRWEIDRILPGLPYGNIVFNTPDTMNVQQPQTIQVELSASAAMDALRKKITASGPLNSDRIKISDLLDIHLTGATFQIQAMTPELQPVGTHTTSHWEWQVTPTQSGAQQLELTVNAVFKIDGADREFSIQTYNKAIEVKVNWLNSVTAFFAGNWQWLWTTLFVPLIVVVWRRFRTVKPDKAA